MARMIAVPRPGGTLLIANLTSFNTASIPNGWTKEPDPPPHAGYALTATEFDSDPDFLRAATQTATFRPISPKFDPERVFSASGGSADEGRSKEGWHWP